MEKEMINTSRKAVLITGCDSGFGHKLATKLNSHGIKVFATCLNPNGTGAQILNKMKLELIEMDVTNDDSVKRAVITVEKSLKDNKLQLFAVINNAGLFTVGEIEWGSIDSLMKVFDVNVFGLTRVTRHFLPLIRMSCGRVINIASLAGRFTTSGLAFYSMTKHAVISLSDALRREMNKWDVKVITIEPEAYRTPMAAEQNVMNILHNIWEETAQEIKSDYGGNYFYAFKERVSMIMRVARYNTEEVTDAVFDAVTAVSPEIRYKCCGPYTNIFWWMFEHLPIEIMDSFINIASVMDVKPRALD